MARSAKARKELEDNGKGILGKAIVNITHSAIIRG